MKFRIDNLLKRAKHLIDGYHWKNFAFTVFKSSYLRLKQQILRTIPYNKIVSFA